MSTPSASSVNPASDPLERAVSDPASIYFHDASFDGQFGRTLAYAYADSADLGEAFATARKIGARSTNATKWYDEWTALAQRVESFAGQSLMAGHTVSARNAYLRATEYYRQAFYFTRGDPTARRLLRAYDDHVAAFGAAAELMTDWPVPDFTAAKVEIPFENASLPAYFFTAGADPRPTLFMPCGYDSTAESAWYGVPDALLRGYNVIVVEGPGQGGALYKQGLYFRPDYEVVATAVVDWLGQQAAVDQDRIAIIGRSFAGYLAPRAAAFEHRFAALVCDPAQPDMGDKVPTGIAERVAGPTVSAMMKVSDQKEEFFKARMAAHGIEDVREYFEELRKFTMIDDAHDITCPTLIVEAENDFAGGAGQVLFDKLTCPKEIVHLTVAQGADGHCGGLGQTVWAQEVYDWLDTVLA